METGRYEVTGNGVTADWLEGAWRRCEVGSCMSEVLLDVTWYVMVVSEVAVGLMRRACSHVTRVAVSDGRWCLGGHVEMRGVEQQACIMASDVVVYV